MRVLLGALRLTRPPRHRDTRTRGLSVYGLSADDQGIFTPIERPVVFTRHSVIQKDRSVVFRVGQCGARIAELTMRRARDFATSVEVPSEICPKCAVENAHDAKFCSQCGASLG